ncbi:hypothetical protein [Paraflavitalea soli]|uniref:hypothetical protein n=1 Tax=Paraflavitalea soli TaxID=2315862 RepID=UPI0013C503D3|nr:hypothetical protein [Paraflavitalea soli]
MKRSTIAAVLATLYLLIYCFCLQMDALRIIGVGLYFFSPVVMIGLAMIVIKDGKYNGPELGEEEFGYQDRDKKTLGPV